MGIFTDQDRILLTRACEVAEAAKHAPERLSDRVEPSWVALLAVGTKEIASAIFVGGDNQDAVQALIAGGDPENSTLYLTLEPKAGFERLPPVTESIRHLGIKRVVIGTLDPSQKFRGEGAATLERMGVEVVLADGEEARRAQTLLDDYSKWLHKGVAALRARVELHALPAGGFDLKFSQQQVVPASVDAVIYRAGKVPAQPIGEAWQIVLDAEGWERPAPRRVLYQSSEAPQIPGTRRIDFQNGLPDLGALLRDLASIGLLTVELADDADLFRLALKFGLIETLQFPGDTVQALARVDKVSLSEGSEPLELRFNNTRYSELSGPNRYLEARVELC
jgi:pyrimidine deaminase RibD-like protein